MTNYFPKHVSISGLCCLLGFLLLSNTAFSTPKPVINLIEEERKLEQQLNEAERANGAGTTNEEGVKEDEYDGLYKIELLVFAYVKTGEENSEIWRNPLRPEFNDFQAPYLPQLVDNDSEENLSTESSIREKYFFLDIDEPNTSEFGDIKRKMAINGHYRVLQHLVWQQKVLEEKDNDLFYIEGGERYPSYEEVVEKQNAFQTSEDDADSILIKPIGTSELGGTIKIYRSRYLHIKPDLWFTEFAINDVGMCLEDGSIKESHANQGIKSYTALTNFHINQHRRLKSGEINYIDHPRFGFLIKFTNIEKPKEPNKEQGNLESSNQ